MISFSFIIKSFLCIKISPFQDWFIVSLSLLNGNIDSIKSDYVSKTVNSTVKSQIVMSKPSQELTNTSYQTAALRLYADYSTNNNARAQIGFENAGSNAGALYLRTDGKLGWRSNTGIDYTITMTQN